MIYTHNLYHIIQVQYKMDLHLFPLEISLQVLNYHLTLLLVIPLSLWLHVYRVKISIEYICETHV